MPEDNDFAAEYARMCDSELLALCEERASLAGSAATALNLELEHRGLTQTPPSDSTMTLVEQPDTDELPYRWARFVGGFTVVLGLLGFAAGLMRLDWRAVVGSVIGLGMGFGIYEQRKWAVMLVEALTCLTVASAVWSLAEGRSHEKHIVAVILVLFYAPQILYFWKRHKQLR